MINQNKYLLLFLGLLFLLGIGVVIDLGKVLHLTFQHTAYYCQAFIKSFSLRIPHSLGTFLLFFIGASVMAAAVKLLSAYIQIHTMKRSLRRNVIVNESFQLILKGLNLTHQALLIKDNKPFAFCFGLRRPKIYLSTKMYNLLEQKELEAVLLHESYHLQKSDTLTLFVASFVQFLFPFFPVVSDLVRNYRIERELNADKEALKSISDPDILLNTFKKLFVYTNTNPAFVSAIIDSETIESRIKALTAQNFLWRKFSTKNMFISLLSFSIFYLLALAPVFAIKQNNKNSEVMICTVSNDCSRWCREHSTVTPNIPSRSPNTSYPYTPVVHSI